MARTSKELAICVKNEGYPVSLELRKLYHLLFRGGKKLSTTVIAARKQFVGEPARVLLDFVASAKRGLCADTSARMSVVQSP